MNTTSNPTDDLALLNDDIFGGAVAAPDVYPDAPGPTPITGRFRLKPTSIELKKDREGKLIEPTTPTFRINFVIVSAAKPDQERLIGRAVNFVEVSTKPKARAFKGMTHATSAFGDLIRGFDRYYDWQNSPKVGMSYILEQIADSGSIDAYIDIKAWDHEFYLANGGPDLTDDEALKDLRNKCSFQGAAKFNADGTVEGPSGKVLKGKNYLRQIYPAGTATV